MQIHHTALYDTNGQYTMINRKIRIKRKNTGFSVLWVYGDSVGDSHGYICGYPYRIVMELKIEIQYPREPREQ